jgi:pyridoxamine 5'-phosphate oxidase
MINDLEYLTLFKNWYLQASETEAQVDAMSLATCDKNGNVSNRIVLLKGYDQQGFVFYTNLTSKKSEQLAENPKAALCFFWPSISKQVRIQGTTIPVSKAEADNYFATRPRGSQIGAWASKQSQALTHYDDLLKQTVFYEEKFVGTEIPRPAFWSGFKVIPDRVEFWELGEWRLHKRLVFECVNEIWIKKFLYP